MFCYTRYQNCVKDVENCVKDVESICFTGYGEGRQCQGYIIFMRFPSFKYLLKEGWGFID